MWNVADTAVSAIQQRIGTMKKLLAIVLATATMGLVGAPAIAQPQEHEHQGQRQYGEYRQYGQYFGGYQSFDELYQHDLEGIRHGLRDGSYTRQEAREFMVMLRQIRQRELYFRSRDGVLDRREGQDIQRRLERLHDVMHEAHEDGHDDQDDWNDRRDDGDSYRR